jgi:hypothetical protein
VAISIDASVVVFGLIYYGLLCIVFLLRAYERNEELYLKHIFSAQLLPFAMLLTLNLIENHIKKSITLIPMILFLTYDLWYRVITEKKPLHHPKRWPKELIIYLILLYAGSIGLNWYGFLVSEQYGMILVAGFFAMMATYSIYQFKHSRRKNAHTLSQ